MCIQWASPWLTLFLVTVGLGACSQSSPYGEGEACSFGYLDDEMAAATYCIVALSNQDPCGEVARCICEARWGEDDEANINACLENEARTQTGDTWADFCGTDLEFTLGEALRGYAAVKDAEVSPVGPCDAIRTVR
jgi:hypothetical protein